MKFIDAFKKVTDTLKNDKEYREVWKANIAMAFQDEFDEWCKNKVGRNKAPDHIHEISNEAAERFLEMLCADVK